MLCVRLHGDCLLDLTVLENNSRVVWVASTMMLDEDIMCLVGLVLADKPTW